MATGQPVRGISVIVGERNLTADADGRLAVPVSGSVAISFGDNPDWTLAKKVVNVSPGSPTDVWAYRVMVVSGRITANSPVAEIRWDRVRLRAFAGGAGSEDAAGASLDLSTLVSSGLDPLDFPAAVEDDGSFSVRVPCIRGYRLTATAPGWRPGSVPLTTAAQQYVSLHLEKPSLMVRGILRDSTGSPLQGANVKAYVYVECRLSKLDRAEIRSAGHSYTLREDPGKDRAVVVYRIDTVTGPDGSFALTSDVTGRLLLQAKPRGDYAEALLEGRSLTTDLMGVELVANRGDGRKVRVLRSGAPLGNRRISFLDLSRRNVQPVSVVQLDANGQFFLTALKEGHEYSIRLHGEMAGRWYIVWDERRTLELDSLRRRR